ncbi:MAG: GEVED domain-containing protein [Pseudomonadota bacterium]
MLRPEICVVGKAPTVTIVQPFDGLIIIEGQPVILSANAFDAEDGDIGASVQWSSDLHGVLGAGAFLEIGLPPGDQILLATVTDSDGNIVSHSVNISVLFNNPPSVDIYSPTNGISIVEGEQLVLDGYAVDSEDGNLTASIQWSSNIDGMLGSGSALNIMLTPGAHTLTASVTDQWGKSAEATTAVTVIVNAPPTVTITTPAGDMSVVEGDSLMLSGNANDDEDGVLTQAIQWSSDIDGALGTGASVEVMLSVGTHQLTATVIDSHGKSGVANRQVTVLFNNPPQLSLVSPYDGQQIEQYLPLALSAVATDQEDGDLSASIIWASDVSGSLGTGGALAVTLPLGTHVITTSITDGNGKMTSITRNITVIAPLVSEYCNVSGTTKSMWIESVTIAGVTNTSGSQGGYADFTGMGPVYLDRMANVIELVPGFSRQSHNIHWSVWIDLNRDGTFSSDEILITADSEMAVSGSVVIPSVADTGLTRMRVMMSRNDNVGSCQDFRAGEVEDYAVVLLP